MAQRSEVFFKYREWNKQTRNARLHYLRPNTAVDKRFRLMNWWWCTTKRYDRKWHKILNENIVFSTKLGVINMTFSGHKIAMKYKYSIQHWMRDGDQTGLKCQKSEARWSLRIRITTILSEGRLLKWCEILWIEWSFLDTLRLDG